MRTERYEAIIIGGGQSGLAAGYELQRRGVDFLILEVGATLDAAAARLDLPVRLGPPVRSLRRSGARYEMLAGDLRYEATGVIVAAGATQDLRWIDRSSLLIEGAPGLHFLDLHSQRGDTLAMIAERIAREVL